MKRLLMILAIILTVMLSAYQFIDIALSSVLPKGEVRISRLIQPEHGVVDSKIYKYLSYRYLRNVEKMETAEYEMLLGTSACIEFIEKESTTYMTIYGERVFIRRIRNEADYKPLKIKFNVKSIADHFISVTSDETGVISEKAYKINSEYYHRMMAFVNSFFYW